MDQSALCQEISMGFFFYFFSWKHFWWILNCASKECKFCRMEHDIMHYFNSAIDYGCMHHK